MVRNTLVRMTLVQLKNPNLMTLELGQSSPASTLMRNNTVIYITSMAMPNTPNSNDNTKVAAELVKSIREDHEIQGSGIKQPANKTNWQIKANSNKDWASNSNADQQEW